MCNAKPECVLTDFVIFVETLMSWNKNTNLKPQILDLLKNYKQGLGKNNWDIIYSQLKDIYKQPFLSYEI